MSELVIQTEIQRGRAVKIIQALSLEKPWRMVVEPHHEQRSVTANRRLWALHQIAAEKIGCSTAELHEDMLCLHYGYHEITMPSGDLKRVPIERSSTKDKPKFNVFMEFCENTYIEKLGVWLTGE